MLGTDRGEQSRNREYLSDLYRWSDVTFLRWQEQCTKASVKANRLRHFFKPVPREESVVTWHIIAEVMRRRRWPYELPPWSKLPSWERRRTFTLDDEDGLALLGTPSMRGLVFMLLQHSAALGRMNIKQIAAFVDQANRKQSAHGLPIADRGLTIFVELEELKDA